MKSVLTVAIALLALSAACRATGERQAAFAPDPSAAGKQASQVSIRPDLAPLVKGPVSPEGLQAILSTSDLGVGKNRVAFALTSPTGLVRSPVATVTSLYFPGDGAEGQRVETTPAFFRKWPAESRGLYSTHLTLDRAGRWSIEITVLEASGEVQTAQLPLQVKESTKAPRIGQSAIRSRNKTVRDVESIGELTTGSLRDPELYQTTIAEATEMGLPTVVVMASPAFCTNAVCGPQVETLRDLKEKYRGRASFIHVDFYDNPHEIQGDLGKAVLSPTVVEWGLPSGEWSFVIDQNGEIAARFEGFATFEELEDALLEVLGAPGPRT